ncbi:MAG: hypothetical protein ACRDRR_14140 [Pseudonocardiaceae bacterium]
MSFDDGDSIEDPLARSQTGIRVHVPFKYDLGGRVKDVDGIRDALTDLRGIGAVEVDQATTRSWNLSYLACHSAVLRCSLPGGTTQIAGSGWRYERNLRIFPWLGVVSVDYEFEPEQVDTNILNFYDGLVEWKNTDYLPYLRECGVMTDGLAAHTAHASKSPAQDLHASLVLQLRARARSYISPRPAIYAFHDFRVCFIDNESILDQSVVKRLLWLAEPGAPDGVFEHVDALRFGSVEISSTGWSTVLRASAGAASPEVAKSVSLLNLAHAQWFICQLWINIYDRDFTETENQSVTVGVHELSACQLSLGRDLSEVGNFDVMLKDPNLLRVARSLERSFGVLDHRKAAEHELRILEDHSRNLTEFAREQTARRLAMLFSLSAAGAVAALVPALVQINFPPFFTLITVLLLIVLWLGFALNFAVLLRWRPMSRKRRKPTVSRKRSAG